MKALLNKIRKLCKKVKVDDEVVKVYVNTGVVSTDVIRLIAFKMIEGKPLTDNETVIFYSETAAINKMIAEVSKKS